MLQENNHYAFNEQNLQRSLQVLNAEIMNDSNMDQMPDIYDNNYECQENLTQNDLEGINSNPKNFQFNI